MASLRTLLVGGGGASADGGGAASGGGGGGEVLYNASFSLNAGSYPVVIGAGGTNAASNGNNGASSTFSSQTAIGGGGSGTNQFTGSTGACGGANNGTGTKGFNGGTGSNVNPYYQGGGGGMGQIGQNGYNATTNYGGAGGYGLSYDISGTATYYGGGGGGGCYSTGVNVGGAGGLGGGGTGATTTAGTAGTANTGGGAGGAYASGAGLLGGSGVVIIRYTTITSPICTGGTITTSGADTIHTFNSSGTFVIGAFQSITLDTVTTTDTLSIFNKVYQVILIETLSLVDSITAIIPKFKNVVKNISTWLNKDKS